MKRLFHNKILKSEIVETNKFGSEPYSIEELTAELGASFLCHIAQIENTALIENSAAYIKGGINSKITNRKTDKKREVRFLARCVFMCIIFEQD